MIIAEIAVVPRAIRRQFVAGPTRLAFLAVGFGEATVDRRWGGVECITNEGLLTAVAMVGGDLVW